MAATESGNSVDEHLNQLRVKLVAAKLANERERLLQRPPSEEDNNDELENQARLQQAMLRRQELLDRIRREQMMNDEAKRPRTYSARRRYTPSPLPVPPTRRSLPPDFARFNYPDTFRAKQPEVPQVTRHVIEHTIKQPPQGYNLPPIDNQNPQQPGFNPQQPAVYQPQQQQPIVLAPPPPPRIMQQPMPQIIQAPAQPHIIATNPTPVITQLGVPEKKESMFRREEFSEQLLMQNAQMHQMVMQKLMLGQLDKTGSGPDGYWHGHHDGHFHGGCHTSHGCHGGCHGGCHSDCHHGDCHNCHPRTTTGAVHHHHYTAAPAPQPEPVVNTYTTMPAYEFRTMPRGYGSAWTSPFTYTYNYEDQSGYPGYYTYH